MKKKLAMLVAVVACAFLGIDALGNGKGGPDPSPSNVYQGVFVPPHNEQGDLRSPWKVDAADGTSAHTILGTVPDTVPDAPPNPVVPDVSELACVKWPIGCTPGGTYRVVLHVEYQCKPRGVGLEGIPDGQEIVRLQHLSFAAGSANGDGVSVSLPPVPCSRTPGNAETWAAAPAISVTGTFAGADLMDPATCLTFDAGLPSDAPGFVRVRVAIEVIEVH